jgi:hypothetical protein
MRRERQLVSLRFADPQWSTANKHSIQFVVGLPDSVQIPNFSWRITAVFVIEVLKLDYYRADTFGNSGGIIVEKLANRIGLLSSQKHPVLELMFRSSFSL